MEIADEIKRPEVAAGVGAVAALVTAVFIPAGAILTATGLAAAGMYAYQKYLKPKGKDDESENENGEEE